MPKPGEKSYLPVDWKRWVAENVLMNADAGDLRRVLTENGFDSEIAQIEIDTAAAHPYVDAARSIARQLSKRDWLLHTLRRLRTIGNPCPFDRRSTVTRDEFLQHYYRQNRPLLLKDYVSHWKAVGLWNREYLRQKAGAITVELQGDRCSNPRYELDPHDHTRTMRFDELVDFCFRDEESNDLYTSVKGRLEIILQFP